MPANRGRGTDGKPKRGRHHDDFNVPEDLAINPQDADVWPEVDYHEFNDADQEDHSIRNFPDSNNPRNDDMASFDFGRKSKEKGRGELGHGRV